MRFSHTQHARHVSRRARLERRIEDARRSGPGGLTIPLVTLAVVFALIALNVSLPGFLGDLSVK